LSNFQRAREALGLRLRELRRDARLTGRQLADVRGWHPSKVSKIENGRQTPSEDDLAGWAESTGAPGVAPELIATLRTLESHYMEFRRLFRAGMAAKQESLQELEGGTAFLRNFENVFVPGLLQTPDYARYRLVEGVEQDGAADDVDAAVLARMQRQQVLYRPGKHFHFVITEAVLRHRLCPVDVMAAQLDRLVAVSGLRHIRFGVIPFGVELPAAPVHGFWIFDEQRVTVENFTAELTLTQPAEVAAYLRLFSTFADVASYGAAARAVLTAALADLV
jgi:transcriptional regulator with XRE-family HTH domain